MGLRYASRQLPLLVRVEVQQAFEDEHQVATRPAWGSYSEELLASFRGPSVPTSILAY